MTQYEIDEEIVNQGLDEEEDDSVIGGDLIEEVNEDERRMLEMAEAEDADDLNDIENLPDKIIGKKRSKPVKFRMEDLDEGENVELEYEREDLQTGSAQIKRKKQKITNKPSAQKVGF